MKGNRDGLKLSQLKAFVAVADCQNFSEAALNLQISQSAVSHAIASLEEELGVVLVSRGRRGAVLTPVGEEVLSHAQEILQSLEAIGQAAERSRGLRGGHIRLASFRSAATHVVAPAIALFRQHYPDISITIQEHQTTFEVEEALRNGQVDVGFTYLPATDEFEAWELVRDEYVVLMPPGEAIATATLTWDHLTSYPMIMPPSNDGSRLLVERYFAEHGYTLKVAYQMMEDSTTLSMVRRGLGMTIIARLAADPIPPDIQIGKLPVYLERIIGVTVLANALHPPAVFAFIETLKGMHQPTSVSPSVSGIA